MLVEVTFLPERTTVWVPAGSTLLAAARRAGITLVASCGGRGTCGGCGVRVLEGTLADPDDVEFPVLPRLPKGVRLGCRARISERVVVEPLVKYRAPITGAASAASFGHATSLYDLEDDDPAGAPAVVSEPAAPVEVPAPDLLVAVDLGTTNVAVAVLEKGSNREVGRGVAANAQRSWGADVLSRLSATLESPEDAQLIRDAAQRSIGEAIAMAVGEPLEMCAQRIVRLVISANSVMAPLVAGVGASSLAVAPFEPVNGIQVSEGPLASILPPGSITVIEPLANFVGGDVRSGLLASDLLQGTSRAGRLDPKTVLFVDMGTNVEVALATPTSLTVASAPAGSAFEGIMTGDTFLVGSALIAALAGLVRTGALDETGLLQESDGRVDRDEHGILRARIESGGEDGAGSGHISQLAIREFQLAKAAVRAAVSGVLSEAGVAPAGVERIVVAGAFGGAVAPRDLIELGVLPDVSPSRMVYAYNASLSGAIMVALGQASEVAVELISVDLPSQPTFTSDLVRYTTLSRG